MFEDLDPLFDVVRSQQPRRFPDRRGAESPADAVAHRGVERDPDESGVHSVHIADVGEPHEGPDAGESRRSHRVDWPVAARSSCRTALRHAPAPTPPLSDSLRG